MFRRARIALACAALSAPAAFAAPAAAQPRSDSDEELDGELDELGEELDEEFRDWGELDEDAVEPEPEPEDEEEEVDPREDMPPAFYDASTWPLADLDRPLALGPGMFELRATVAADLSAGSTLGAVSLAPDLYYGITERLEIGLLHSRFATLSREVDEEAVAALGSHAPAVPATRAGDGLCLGEGCELPYNNVGFEVRLALGAMRGPIQLRAHAGMEAAEFDPLRIGARVGVTGRFRAGSVAVRVDPAIRLGLLRRGAGNDDVFSLPATLQLQVTPRLVAEASSGVYGPTTGLRDGARVPLSIGVLAALSPALDLGASAGFPAIVTGGEQAGGAERAASLFVAYRL